MNLFSPEEITRNYSEIGAAKCRRNAAELFVLAALAGLLVAFGCAATNTAAHALGNVSAIRVVCGLLFPFGLVMIMLTGTELFTGNCLIAISVLEKRAAVKGMVRNLTLVYLGNFAGALLLAAGCVFFGQLDHSGGGLALFTINLAVAKCSLSFGAAVVLGFFCNVLVCVGVLCALSAKDTSGRILGAYVPVSFFVICGFEHCIANMYYIPAGLFALHVPRYAQLAAQAGVDLSALSWGGFVLGNLLPVTIGNILGGVAVGVCMWAGHLRGKKACTGR